MNVNERWENMIVYEVVAKGEEGGILYETREGAEYELQSGYYGDAEERRIFDYQIVERQVRRLITK